MKQIDTVAVKKILQERIARIRERATDGNGPMDVLARLELEVSIALGMWRVEEQNRKTDPNYVCTAMISLAASQVAAEMMACNAFDVRQVSQMSAIFKECLSHYLNSTHAVTSLDPQEVTVS